MRSSPLEALFPKTRQTLLGAMLADAQREWYLSALARHLGVRPSSLQRELATLVEAGILTCRKDGNRTYFQPNPECPFLEELRGIFLKTSGGT